MNRKLKSAFSLAELMITLLILSIILSAVMPAVTKRSATVEAIWRWSDEKANTYFGTGSNQSVLIGVNNTPAKDGSAIADFNYSGTNMTSDGDKLILFKRIPADVGVLANSHITFFQSDYDGSNAHYTGRLAMEQSNIGLGTYTLGNLENPDYSDEDKNESKNNLAIGQEALKYLSTGHSNTAIGNGTLVASKTSTGNTAIGYNTLKNTNAQYGFNTAVGSQAGINNTTGSANTLMGVQAMMHTQTANYNTIIGYLALNKAKNTTNSNNHNVIFGALAGQYTGENNTQNNNNNNNVILGSQAGLNGGKADIASNYNNNVLIGKDAGQNIGTEGASNNNIAIGFQAGTNAKESNNNIFLGISSGIEANGSGNNIFIGTNTGAKATASNNVFIGDNAGQNSTDGLNNLFIGKDSGSNNTTGSNNVFIGYKSGLANTDGSNKLEISSNEIPLIKGSFSIDTPILELLSNDISLGKSSSQIHIKVTDAGQLHLASSNLLLGDNETNWARMTIGDYGIVLDKSFTVQNGNMTVDNGNMNVKNGNLSVTNGNLIIDGIVISPSMVSPSDKRLKDIKGEATEGLNAIDALKVIKFTYKQDQKKLEHIGVIAQDLQKILPNAVIKDEKGFLAVKFTDVMYTAIKAIQELHQAVIELTNNVKSLGIQITDNSNRIKKLEKENQELKEQLNNLEKRIEKIEAKKAS